MSDYNNGDRVKWRWGDNWAEGRITERFEEKTTRTIKGTEVTRDASSNEPAFMIEQDDGDRVLKSVTEVEHAS